MILSLVNSQQASSGSNIKLKLKTTVVCNVVFVFLTCEFFKQSNVFLQPLMTARPVCTLYATCGSLYYSIEFTEAFLKACRDVSWNESEENLKKVNNSLQPEYEIVLRPYYPATPQRYLVTPWEGLTLGWGPLKDVFPY